MTTTSEGPGLQGSAGTSTDRFVPAFVRMVIAVVALYSMLQFGIPRAEDAFLDYGVALPGATRWLLGLGRWLAGRNPGQHVPAGLIIAPTLAAFLVAFWIVALDRSMRPDARSTAIRVFWIVLLLMAVVAAPLAIPFVAMLRSLGSRGL